MKTPKPERSPLPLTDREYRVLRHIARSISETGCQPTYREICHHFNWKSVNSVASILINCVAKGAILRTTTRGIEFSWRQYL